jgi:hypothetical protein
MPSIKIENPPGCAVQMGSVVSLIECKDNIKFDINAKIKQKYFENNLNFSIKTQ